MTKNITPMELLTLFHKSDYSDTNLSVYEHKLLSVLLTFVNHDVSQGYKAWPATDLLIRRTGIKTTTLTTARKSLLREGFLKQITPNAGPGRSCVYYINPDKIVELAEKAGNKASGRSVPKASVPEAKPIHARNTAGLKNQKPAEQPKQESVPEKNPDGSPRYWKNGERRYSWDDVMPKTKEQEYDPWSNPAPEPVVTKPKYVPKVDTYEEFDEPPF